MYIQNQTAKTTVSALRGIRTALSLAVSVTISLYLVFPAAAAGQPEPAETGTFTSSTGLRLKVLKNDHISFIHAQLVIYYKEKIKNPAIPYLTLLNIFDGRLKGNDTPLLSTLKKLGNDYQVEHRPDFLLFKINFLPDKILLFIRFLKILYGYKPFLDFNSSPGSYVDEKQKLNTETRFKDSINNYWNYFIKQKNWKSQISFQIAYDHWFPGAMMGNTFITPNSLKDVTLDQLCSFYERTYRLPDSLLVIKGNIEQPAILHGHIERAFASFKKHRPHIAEVGKRPVNPEKVIFIFNTTNDGTPTMFWFQAVATYDNKIPMVSLVLNNILFSYPTGRLFYNSTSAGIDPNNLHIDTQMENHQGLTVICNTIRLRYNNIGNFIGLVHKERKKLQVQPFNRIQCSNALSNIYGRLAVNTQYFDNEVSLAIIKIEAESEDNKVVLASLKQKQAHSIHELIVIVGNANAILAGLDVMATRRNVKIIDFTR